jgi:hypothetical protein
MKPMEIVRAIMELKDVRPAVLGSRLNIKSNVLSERFKQKNVSVNKLNEMLRVMDYKIVIMPTDGKLPKDSYEVE